MKIGNLFLKKKILDINILLFYFLFSAICR